MSKLSNRRHHYYLQSMGITAWQLRAASKPEHNDTVPAEWFLVLDESDIVPEYDAILLDVLTVLNPHLHTNEDKRKCILQSSTATDKQQQLLLHGEQIRVNPHADEYQLPAIHNWVAQPDKKRAIWAALQTLLEHPARSE